MEQKMEKKNINFFQRIKTAIFKLEDYGNFLDESPTIAFKYFFLLILIAILFISIASTYNFAKVISKVSNYIKSEIPEFTFDGGQLNFKDYVEGYDEEFNFRLIINTFDVKEEEMKEYSNKMRTAGTGVLMLKDKLLLFSDGIQMVEEPYTNIVSEYNLSISNKEDLINSFSNSTRYGLIAIFAIFNLIVSYIIDAFSILADLCLVSVIGWFIAKLCGMNLKMIGSIELSIYSLTLSIILNAIYSSASILTSFRIEYFNIIYLLIAYVYIIAALFIIRDDLLKQQQELDKIYEVEAEVKKEFETKENEKEPSIESDENEEKTDIDEDTKEEESENKNDEPDGSEI